MLNEESRALLQMQLPDEATWIEVKTIVVLVPQDQESDLWDHLHIQKYTMGDTWICTALKFLKHARSATGDTGVAMRRIAWMHFMTYLLVELTREVRMHNHLSDEALLRYMKKWLRFMTKVVGQMQAPKVAAASMAEQEVDNKGE